MTNFQQLILDHREKVLGYAIKLADTRDIADDIAQEAILKALTKEHLFNGDNIAGWLYRITKNTYINYYRFNTRFVTSIDKDVLFDLMESNVDQGSTYDYKFIAGEINNLPEIYKESFILYISGYSYKEIAENINVPIGTVKSRIHLARKALKKKLDN
jgi:RNA polymerase sigma-70 factor (ECF subfamily)